MLTFPTCDRLLADLLPAGVVGFAIRGDHHSGTSVDGADRGTSVDGADRGTSVDGADLTPGEEAVLGRVGPMRRWQFAAGRSCGRRALAALGCDPEAILVGSGGEPCWPVGVTGSITHCRGYAAAIATTTAKWISVGLDAEPHQPISPRLLAHIALPGERAWIAAVDGSGMHFDRLLFSVKESVYKAWYPLTARRLGFTDVRVSFQPVHRRWWARLMMPRRTARDAGIRGFAGSYAIDGEFVLSFAAAKTKNSVLSSKPTSVPELLGGCDA